MLPRAILFVPILLITATAEAKNKPWKPWPCAQCTGGWIDAMTGMCPYRPRCKAGAANEGRNGAHDNN